MYVDSTQAAAAAGIPANRDRLFLAACVSLVVTSMTFAIRAGILTELGTTFALTGPQLGWVNSMAFLGFPIAMIIGGLLYNSIGPRNMLWTAFICHLLGLVLTIFAGDIGPLSGFWGLMISTFFIGFANGAVEAACNPMVADMYPEKKTQMLNKFHVWFPGGIVIGSLIANFFGDALGWQGLIATMFIPTFLYAFLIFGQEFPRSNAISKDTGENIRSLATPLFLFIVLCMTLTATTEFSTTQWVEKILGASGASPMIVLALVTGLMAVGRFFAGPIVHNLNPTGVLLISAVLSTIGIYLLSTLTGGAVYFGAIVFALGICYFWPTMIGFVGEYIPQTGALGMSLVGGAGMFALVIWNPIIGGWLDDARATAETAGAIGAEADIIAGQATLSTMMWFPIILVVLFTGLYFYMRNRHQVPADEAVLNPDAMSTPGSAR
ncbi:MFS family permease [Lewinella marina]|uniref:MFS transporter n=1 Tax=Neolewinella marina TaxID=438751 RepID=A0A2G0CGV5_9BACT|nr:MFS transporter [Neolewinella marina]NJB86323.1 MFS family permease [Neolewinella marina]PHK99206.1 MFS transporter [Neolewinella marina]